MQNIKSILDSKKLDLTKSRKTEWGEHVQYFHDRINKERGKYEPISMARMGKYLAPFKDDIYFFKQKCEKAKSFQACFWYHVKPKKESKKLSPE